MHGQGKQERLHLLLAGPAVRENLGQGMVWLKSLLWAYWRAGDHVLLSLALQKDNAVMVITDILMIIQNLRFSVTGLNWVLEGILSIWA